MPENKPDWILTTMAGGLNDSFAALSGKQIFASQYDLRDKEEYWNRNDIKSQFTKDGVENRKAFDDFFEKNSQRYKAFRIAESEISSFPENKNPIERDFNSGTASPKVTKSLGDMWGRSFGVNDYDGQGYSAKERGWRETANQRGVRLETGKYVPLTEFKGLAKYATDEDGQIAIDEQGSPFLVPVKSEEQLKPNEQIYNPYYDWFGYYGHDYSKKQVLGFLTQNHFLNFLGNTFDSIAEIPKMFMNPQSEAYKSVINAEQMAKQWSLPMTERGSEGFFTLESIANLGADVIWQLGSMVATGGAISAMAKGAGFAGKAAALGSNGSKLFMSTIAAGPIADVARANGLSEKESSALFAVLMGVLFPVMNLSEFAAKGISLNKATRHLDKVIRESGIFALKPGKVDLKSLRSIATNVKDNTRNVMAELYRAAPVVGGMAGESLEETVEQTLDIGVRSLYNLYNFVSDGETDKRFKFDWIQEFENLGVAAAGGAIGGGMGNRIFRALGVKQPKFAQDIAEMVADGETQTLLDHIEKRRREGGLDYTFLDEKGQFVKDDAKSRNEQVANILTGMVNAVDQLATNYGVKDIVRSNEKMAEKFGNFRSALPASSIGKDAADIFNKLINLDAQIQEKGTLDAPKEELAKLVEEKERLVNQLNAIRNGSALGDYINEGAYNLFRLSLPPELARLETEFDVLKLKHLSGKNFVNLSKTLTHFASARNNQILEKNNQITDESSKATIDDYGVLLEKDQKRILKDGFNELTGLYNQLLPYYGPINFFEELVSDTEEGRNAALSALLSVRDFQKKKLDDPNAVQALQAIPDEVVNRVQELVGKIDNLQSGQNVISLDSPVDESSMFLNMVEDEEGEFANTIIPIETELLRQEDISKTNPALYTGSKDLTLINNSINARIAQLIALPKVAEQTKDFMAKYKATPYYAPNDVDSKKIIARLEDMKGRVVSLMEQAEANKLNAERRVRELTINAAKEKVAMIEKTSNMLADKFLGFHKIFAAYHVPMLDALEKNNLKEFLKVERAFEAEVYTKFHNDRNTLLEHIIPKGTSYNLEATANAELNSKIRKYDYLRGILSLSADDFWNAYYSAVNSMKDGVLRTPSEEQEYRIKETVMNLMGTEYRPYETASSKSIYMDNAAYMDGYGGSGKTSMMIPLIAAIHQKIAKNQDAGTKVFFTAKRDDDNFRHVNVNNQVDELYKKSETESGLDILHSPESIIKLLEADSDNLSLIVIDEATLFTQDELRQITEKQREINAKRIADSQNPPLLKILYTGDMRQINEGASDGSPWGSIMDQSFVIVPKSESVQFSFRSQNQELKILTDYLEEAMVKEGFGNPLMLKYQNEQGARVFNSYSEFTQYARDLVNDHKAKGKLDQIVYITDSPAEVDAQIRNSKVRIITPLESQGREWETVISDIKAPLFRTPINDEGDPNIINKRQHYTAATRARTYWAGYLPEAYKIKSIEGQVGVFTPIRPEIANKQAKLAWISDILNNNVEESYKSNVTYNPATNEQVINWGDEQLQQVIDQAMQNDTQHNALLDYIKGRGQELRLHTFYNPALKAEFAKKNKILFDIIDKKGASKYNLQLTVAKQGTGKHKNALNRTDKTIQAERSNKPGVFIEAVSKDNPEDVTILGVFADKVFDDAIGEGKIFDLTGKDEISYSLEHGIFDNAYSFKPFVVNNEDFNKARNLSTLKKEYEGVINFGTPRIVTEDFQAKTSRLKDGQDVSKHFGRNAIIVPISTKYSAEQIDEILKSETGVDNDFISFVGMDKGKISMSEIISLSDEMYDDRGNFDITYKDDYMAIWGNDAGFRKEGNSYTGKNNLHTVLADIHKSATGDFKDFVGKYMYYEPVSKKQITDLETQAAQTEDEAKKKQFLDKLNKLQKKSDGMAKTYYLLSDYMQLIKGANKKPTYLSNGKSRIPTVGMYQQLFKELENHKLFEKGFRFNPTITRSQSEKTQVGQRVHVPVAMPKNKSIVEEHLSVNISFLSPPSIQIKANRLMAGILRIKPSTATQNVKTGTSTVVDPRAPQEEQTKQYDDNKKINNLTEFENVWFKGGLKQYTSEAVTRFKRAFYNSFYDLENGFSHDVNTAVENLKNLLDSRVQEVSPEFIKMMNDRKNWKNPNNVSKYIDYVLYRNSDWLLTKYAPMIYKNPKTGFYEFQINHVKSGLFHDKESQSLLHETMNEAVRTHLWNTPIVRKKKKGKGVVEYETVRSKPSNPASEQVRFLTEGDFEEIIDFFKKIRSSEVEVISNALKDSNSEVLQSLYVRFFSREQQILDGRQVYSLWGIATRETPGVEQSINQTDALQIVNVIAKFFETGEIFSLRKINFGENKYDVKLNTNWKPSIVVDNGQESISHAISAITNMTLPKGNNLATVTMGNVTMSLDRKANYSDEQILGFLRNFGLDFVTQEHLDSIIEYDGANIGILSTSNPTEVRNKFILDKIIFPIIEGAAKGETVFTPGADVLYRAVMRVNGVNPSLNTINIGKNKVYRLRNSAPVFHLQRNIDENQALPLFAQNLLNKKRYKITNYFVRDGVERFEKGQRLSKSNSEMTSEEQMMLDVFYGFAQPLMSSITDNQSARKVEVALPLTVYSDGSSDVIIVVEMESPFEITNTKRMLFESRVNYYTELERDMLARWSAALGQNFFSIQQLDAYLKANPVPFTVIKGKNLTPNLHYVAGKKDIDPVYIKPTLIDKIQLYKPVNYANFEARLDQNYEKFRASVDQVTLAHVKAVATERYDAEDILKAYYYNWNAASSELLLHIAGAEEQFKGKGSTIEQTRSNEYIDSVKRNKLMISNHSSQIFRDESWEQRRQDYLANGQQLPNWFIEEGKKLSRKNYKVAFVQDIGRPITSFGLETKNQMLFDGATFAFRWTRVMQKASNGGIFGENIAPVMKNITSWNSNGIGNFIKNAEFEITPELMRKGNANMQHMVQQALSLPVIIDGVQTTPWNIVTTTDILNPNGTIRLERLKEDLSNADARHFMNMMDILVVNGQQDSLIHEIAITSSVKTGGESITGITDNYVPVNIDLQHKGSQLDASKDTEEGLLTTATSQLFNALGLNWNNPGWVAVVHNGLRKLSNNVISRWTGMSTKDLNQELRKIVEETVSKREGVTYAHSLIATDYSFDDRQILNTLITNLNSVLAKSAVAPKFQGGQYVLHPFEGLVDLYQVTRNRFTTVVTKDQLLEGEAFTIRNLRWSEPVNRVTGKRLSETKEWEELVAASSQQGITREQRKVLQQQLQVLLSDGNWEGGEAEIMLPMEMKKSFGLEEGIVISDITSEYFEDKIRKLHENDEVPISETDVKLQAAETFKSFQLRLQGIMIRIPTTGKHSAVATKVIGFINDSKNSVFCPTELYLIQGSDQDIDKGSYLTYDVIQGIVPFVNEKGELWSGYRRMFRKRKDETQEAFDARMQRVEDVAVRNTVVQAIFNILKDPQNTVEANISTESVKQELHELRDERIDRGYRYDRDDYVSLIKMKEVNNVGKKLVGLFANSNKAFSILHDAARYFGYNNGIDIEKAVDTSLRLSSLTNGAVDDAKDQAMGILNINANNANMVAYMVIQGKTFREIVEFFERPDNQAFMQKIYDKKRFDSKDTFIDAEKDFDKKSEFYDWYIKAEEFAAFATAVINRDLPNSAYEMYALRNRVERYVNNSFKKAGFEDNFDFIEFINNESYRTEMIKRYQELVDDKESKHTLNILTGYTVPHILGYMQTYATANAIIKSKSKVNKMVDAIADEDSKNTKEDRARKSVSEEKYNKMVDFTYAAIVGEFVKGTKVAGYDLSTPSGRKQFVDYIHTTFRELLRNNEAYADNKFVNSLTVVDEKVWSKHLKSEVTYSRLRTFDLMNLQEEALIDMSAGFADLDPEHRKVLAMYSLITSGNKVGKGSIAPLFEPSDFEAFNKFLKRFKIPSTEILYTSWSNYDAVIWEDGYNAIPFTLEESFVMNPPVDEGVDEERALPVYIKDTNLTPAPGVILDYKGSLVVILKENPKTFRVRKGDGTIINIGKNYRVKGAYPVVEAKGQKIAINHSSPDNEGRPTALFLDEERFVRLTEGWETFSETADVIKQAKEQIRKANKEVTKETPTALGKYASDLNRILKAASKIDKNEGEVQGTMMNSKDKLSQKYSIEYQTDPGMQLKTVKGTATEIIDQMLEDSWFDLTENDRKLLETIKANLLTANSKTVTTTEANESFKQCSITMNPPF